MTMGLVSQDPSSTDGRSKDAGEAVFFVCNKKVAAEKFAGAVRTRIGAELDALEKNEFRFCWIVDFLMYERNPDTGQIEFSHNPFSMPQGGLEALETKDTLTLKAYQYDIVCNGVELSSGAIRNHLPDIMYKAFAIAGYSRGDVEGRGDDRQWRRCPAGQARGARRRRQRGELARALDARAPRLADPPRTPHIGGHQIDTAATADGAGVVDKRVDDAEFRAMPRRTGARCRSHARYRLRRRWRGSRALELSARHPPPRPARDES